MFVGVSLDAVTIGGPVGLLPVGPEWPKLSHLSETDERALQMMDGQTPVLSRRDEGVGRHR